MVRRTVVLGLALVLSHALGGLVLLERPMAPLWPSAGVVVLWGLLCQGRRELLGCAFWTAVLTLVTLTIGGLSAHEVVGYTLSHLAAAVLPALAAARLVKRPAWPHGPVLASRDGRPGSLGSMEDAYRVLFAIAPAIVVASLLGESTEALVHGWDWARLGSWVFRFATAAVVVALPVLAVASPRSGVWRPRWTEVAALALVTALVQWVVFGSGNTLPIGYASLVLVFWSALRLPLQVTVTHGAAMALSAYLFIEVSGHGPFTTISSSRVEELALQGYMVMATLLALLIGSAMADRESLVDSLAESEAQARHNAAEAEQLFADAPHGVAVLSERGEVLRANPALSRLLGFEGDSLTGRTLAELPPPQSSQLTQQMQETLRGESQQATGDWDYIAPDGDELHLSFSSRVLGRGGTTSEDGRVLVNVVDLSERRRYERQLAHMAEHDALTGLANRRQFDRVLAEHEQRCRRDGPRGALLLLDLDHFKEVNDTLGHDAGDQLITTTASVLRRAFRATDVVARLGGDEFAVLLPEATQEQAEHVAAAVIEGVQEHAATLDGVRRRITASVGVATFAAAARLGTDPLSLADLLMYDAKDSGRNQFASLDESTPRQPRTSARMAWRTRLERALEQDLFALHLQPILNLQSDRIASAEALLRLVDESEPVPPGRFVYIAEQQGLAPQMDAWVVWHAVELLARLQRLRPRFSLTVNVSGHSLGDPVLETAIVDALRKHGVDPRTLVVEVTETAAVSDVTSARDFAARMSALGVRLALDDFGAGFGSFYYLKYLDFDLIKIDGEFVANASANTTDQAIIRSLVGISRDLGKRTVAEFVADEAALAIVRRLGVDFAQGFHIGRPVPEPDFITQHLTGPAR